GRDCREGPGRPGPRLHRERVLAPPAGPLRRWMGQAASGGFSEVVMGCPAEVFVRPVTMTEGRRLQRIGRTAKDPVKLWRAIVVLMSAQGQSAPDIAHLLDCSPEYVRTVIHAFKENGFAAL